MAYSHYDRKTRALIAVPHCSARCLPLRVTPIVAVLHGTTLAWYDGGQFALAQFWKNSKTLFSQPFSSSGGQQWLAELGSKLNKFELLEHPGSVQCTTDLRYCVFGVLQWLRVDETSALTVFPAVTWIRLYSTLKIGVHLLTVRER